MFETANRRRLSPTAFLLILTCGCAQEMMDQRRVESQEQTAAFADGVASRPIPPHTFVAGAAALRAVSTGQTGPDASDAWAVTKYNDDGYWDGRIDGELVDEVPKPALDRSSYRELILRGQTRFNIFCAPCHDRTGSGNGMVPRRGFKYPPSYHTERLRRKPIGYIFSVATHGRGHMPGYGDFIATRDRWAIAAYVRTLQFSQFAPVLQLSDADRAELFAAPKSEPQPTELP